MLFFNNVHKVLNTKLYNWRFQSLLDIISDFILSIYLLTIMAVLDDFMKVKYMYACWYWLVHQKTSSYKFVLYFVWQSHAILLCILTLWCFLIEMEYIISVFVVGDNMIINNSTIFLKIQMYGICMLPSKILMLDVIIFKCINYF